MRQLLLLVLLFTVYSFAQEKGCSLNIGTNISGITDWSTEIPFKNLMYLSREWFTQNDRWVENGENPWDSGYMSQIPVDSNGYPLSLPAHFPDAEAPQRAVTIWAYINAWPAGEYVLLWDGKGRVSTQGDLQLLTESENRQTYSFSPKPLDESQLFILGIDSSDAADPVRNIRLLLPGTEDNYLDQPYNPKFLEKLAPFSTIRFMDFGKTNNWSETNSWECYDSPEDTIRKPWSFRSKPSFYTFTTNKGVPYEYMIRLCNITNKNMWICVPHNASDEYIRNMAMMVRDNLNPEFKIYVEYSNEIWNWMFGQTQWLNTFFCEGKGIYWPEGVVPLVQNCLDIWSDVFKDEMSRIIRVVGVQGAWQDVSNRIVFNLRPGSFDAFSPAAYFGLDGEYDAILDDLGSSATVSDLAHYVRLSKQKNEIPWLISQKQTIGDSLKIPMIYYEGGQHVTPTPFGEEPTYSSALLDIQRDTSMYNLYNEWFELLESLNDGDEPTLLMSFSFIGTRSARYGSWGILETLDQDTSLIPAPKYKAIMEYMNKCNTSAEQSENLIKGFSLKGNYPNPFNPSTTIEFEIPAGTQGNITLKIYDMLGREVAVLVKEPLNPGIHKAVFDPSKHGCSSGVYFCRLSGGGKSLAHKMIFLK